jgi:hypothetical protein
MKRGLYLVANLLGGVVLVLLLLGPPPGDYYPYPGTMLS